jgi:hypothetical protein
LVVGATRSGKSQLSRELFLSAAPPRLVIDSRDSDLTNVQGAVTFRDPRQLEQLADEETLRFVPRDPADQSAFDDVYAWCFEHYPRYVWCDEPDEAMGAHRFPRHANVYVVQGAKRGLGHLCCSTGPLWLMKSLYRNLQHLVVFDLPVADDRVYVAKNAGIPLADFEAAMAEAAALTKATPDGPKGGFVWWEQQTRTLTILPPLDLGS